MEKWKSWRSLPDRLTLLVILSCSIYTVTVMSELEGSNPSEPIKKYYQSAGKKSVTFLGFSSLGYENPMTMKRYARTILKELNPRKVVITIGASCDGIGEIYPIAKELGFTTVGIISSIAKEKGIQSCRSVDKVFIIEDSLWGGIDPQKQRLSPTSGVIIETGDVFIGIGGGRVAADEIKGAIDANKKVVFIPLEMNHAIAISEAHRHDSPIPNDFGGEASRLFPKLPKDPLKAAIELLRHLDSPKGS